MCMAAEKQLRTDKLSWVHVLVTNIICVDEERFGGIGLLPNRVYNPVRSESSTPFPPLTLTFRGRPCLAHLPYLLLPLRQLALRQRRHGLGFRPRSVLQKRHFFLFAMMDTANSPSPSPTGAYERGVGLTSAVAARLLRSADPSLFDKM